MSPAERDIKRKKAALQHAGADLGPHVLLDGVEAAVGEDQVPRYRV